MSASLPVDHRVTEHRRLRTGQPVRSLVSLTEVKVSAQLSVENIQMKVTTKEKNLVVVEENMFFIKLSPITFVFLFVLTFNHINLAKRIMTSTHHLLRASRID